MGEAVSFKYKVVLDMFMGDVYTIHAKEYAQVEAILTGKITKLNKEEVTSKFGLVEKGKDQIKYINIDGIREITITPLESAEIVPLKGL